MNTLILQFKKVTPVCLILSALACFAFSSRAEAAPVPNPPAPGVLNTRDGQSAMPFVTTGIANSAFGAFSLFSVITGNFNTAVGVAALDLNTASNNTAVGAAALLLNTIGSNNTAVGASALLKAPGYARRIAQTTEEDRGIRGHRRAATKRDGSVDGPAESTGSANPESERSA